MATIIAGVEMEMMVGTLEGRGMIFLSAGNRESNRKTRVQRAGITKGRKWEKEEIFSFFGEQGNYFLFLKGRNILSEKKRKKSILFEKKKKEIYHFVTKRIWFSKNRVSSSLFSFIILFSFQFLLLLHLLHSPQCFAGSESNPHHMPPRAARTPRHPPVKK